MMNTHQEMIYQSRIGIWEYDVRHNTNSWSADLFVVLELEFATVPDNTLVFSFYAEPYQSSLKKAVAEAYQSGKSWDLELELTTAKGRKKWVRTYGHAVLEDNVVRKVKGMLMDIDRYRSNETSFNLLKQRHKQLSSFTHTLTHNLRNHTNNMALIVGMVDKGRLDAENADLFDKLAHVAGHLRDTIDQMSEIVKVNENVMESQLLHFDERLSATMALLEAELTAHQADVQTDFLIPAVLFPKVYLDSILMNLLSNSVKYRKMDASPQILLSTYMDEDQHCLVLEYQDNGIGIDLEKHGDQLFGLYQTFTNRPDAHGVGLFLVKNQIESQGGYIIVESAPGIGTIFRLFFKPQSR